MRRTTLVLLLLLGPAAVASAQQTGSVSGTVFDQNGNPLAEVMVRIVGDLLPAGRTATTSETGQYAFTLLLPGAYVVEASKTEIGTSKRTALVEVARDTQLDLVLGLVVEEAIEVVATIPVVDMKSSEIAFNYQGEYLRTIPLERSYKGLFQLIPGVADNRTLAGPAAGGTRQDNAYLIDGVNITNPLFGYLSTEINELDIAEVNIKRAGISAEFGRTAGAATNAVTRSGTNRLSGQARIDWLSKGLIGEPEDNRFRDPLLTTVTSPAVGIGGPLLPDRLFFYGSARWFKETNWDRANKLGESLPDEERKGHELYGKVTATPGARHLVNVGYRTRPNDVENASLNSERAATVATTTDNSSRVATATWAYFLTDRSSIDVKYLYMKENNQDDPVTILGYLPTWNPNDLASMGLYTDPLKANLLTGGNDASTRKNYRRHEARGTYVQFFDFGRSNHELRAGGGYEFGEEDYFALTNGWGQLSVIGTGAAAQIRARYYHEQPPQLGQGRTWGLFVQDNVSIGSRLTINAGVLVNRDEFAQELEGSGGCPDLASLNLLQGGPAVYTSSGDLCTFLRFDLGDQIQPRLGINLNVRPEAGDKVYANWGRYYNTDQKSSGRSLAPRRIFQREAFYTLAGALVSDLPRVSTSTKRIDPKMDPTYIDEFLIGYSTPLRNEWNADLFFIHRGTHDFIEDVPSVLPTGGPFVAANLPCEDFAGCIGADARRSYRAFTVEVARRLGNRWSANASYTWSRFEGNFDLDYATGFVFNTSSLIQDGPGAFVQEPNRFGPLRQDRTHVLKLFGTWMPTEMLTLGGYIRVQSGAPWNARGQDRAGASALNYLEPAGSHRNPTWGNLDLLASYRLRLNERAVVSLEGRLLNALGNQTVISTDSVQFLDTPVLPVPPYIGTYTLPNPLFNTANGFAPPRRLVLAAVASF
jgi:hypothetical protein